MERVNGSTESDYRPTRWVGFREDYRFTGKEEDIEVGLSYFGARGRSWFIFTRSFRWGDRGLWPLSKRRRLRRCLPIRCVSKG